MFSNYPMIQKVCRIVKPPTTPLLGREFTELHATLRNPEKANAILLADPGVGKSAYVSGFAKEATNYIVLSVATEQLVDKDAIDKDVAMQQGIMQLVDEVEHFVKQNNQLVALFIDEFHRIVMTSPSAVEVLKPILEKSASAGFRIIAATTYEEYDEWITKNRALDQRFVRISIPELPKSVVLDILRTRALSHGVAHLADPSIYEDIYATSRQVLISNAQPRASVDILNTMIGYITKSEEIINGEVVRTYKSCAELGVREFPLSRPVLNHIIRSSYGIDIDNNISVNDVREALTKKLLNQEQAIETIMSKLEMIWAGFIDPTRPKLSFLSPGSTGVGKALDDNTLVPVLRDSEYQIIRHGDIRVGDYVFSRLGKPIRVTGVYPQGLKQVHRVMLSDGRYADAADDHLWDVFNRKQWYGNSPVRFDGTWTITTKTLHDKMARNKSKGNYALPSNHALDTPALPYKTDPYVIGALLGDGCLSISGLTFSSQDKELVDTIAQSINGIPHKCSDLNCNWVFRHNPRLDRYKNIQTKDVLSEVPELIGTLSHTKFIPDIYKRGSIEQRWELIRGLFDTDGCIKNDGYRYHVRYISISKQLIEDIRDILYSLGVSSRILESKRPGRQFIEYQLHVLASPEVKPNFFKLSRKRKLAEQAVDAARQRTKNYEFDRIASVEILDKYVPMTCIMVDDPEHLYQLANGMVTHNTEAAKIISETMGIPLKRFDMSRYSRPEDAVKFADELSQAAWSAPNAYILIDEVEKSTREAMNILLQVLDDARLTSASNSNRVISFTGNIIHLTTNLGTEVFKTAHKFDNNRIDLSLIYKALSDDEVFETAVLGRIDQIVPFAPLPEDTLKTIAERELNKQLDVVRTENRPIHFSKDVINFIVLDKMANGTESGGARDAIRSVKNLALQPIASYIAKGLPERPLALMIEGRALHKYSDIREVDQARIIMKPCHTLDVIDKFLEVYSANTGKQIRRGKDCFVPVDMTLNTLANLLHVHPGGELNTTFDDDRLILL